MSDTGSSTREKHRQHDMGEAPAPADKILNRVAIVTALILAISLLARLLLGS